MKPPIIAVATDDGEVLIFDEPERVGVYCEPIDVRNGVYEFYDSEGKVLIGGVHKLESGVEKTSVKDKEPSEHQPGRLQSYLIEYLVTHRSEDQKQIGKFSLTDLVEYTASKYRLE